MGRATAQTRTKLPGLCNLKGKYRVHFLPVTFLIAIRKDLTLDLLGARDGIGIAALPEYMCNQGVQNKCLKRVLADWEIAPVELHALYPSHRGATPKLRVFLDCRVAKLADRLN